VEFCAIKITLFICARRAF